MHHRLVEEDEKELERERRKAKHVYIIMAMISKLAVTNMCMEKKLKQSYVLQEEEE